MRIIETHVFSRRKGDLIKAHKLTLEDFDSFKRSLVETPEVGKIIQGTGGVRKTRLNRPLKGRGEDLEYVIIFKI